MMNERDDFLALGFEDTWDTWIYRAVNVPKHVCAVCKRGYLLAGFMHYRFKGSNEPLRAWTSDVAKMKDTFKRVDDLDAYKKREN